MLQLKFGIDFVCRSDSHLYRNDTKDDDLYAGFLSLYPTDFSGPAWDAFTLAVVKAFDDPLFAKLRNRATEPEQISVYAGTPYIYP